MSESQEIVFDELTGQSGQIGVITLNRPEALNSLNHEMIHALHKQLIKWSTAPSIKAVAIGAKEGRAFCAGGDIRLTYDRRQANDPRLTHFFRDEYLLNQFIFHYPKPYIAFLDGITMGGGVGISIHGSHRIGTDKLLFAMPETGIGFYPDVGGTYFLPRLPGHTGYYLGLTGARVKLDDCMALGIVQNKIAHEDWPVLLQMLADKPFTDHPNEVVTDIISEFKITHAASTLMEQEEVINDCFSRPTVETISTALEKSNGLFSNETLAHLQKKSPTSLKVTLAALQQGKHLDFDACMQQEYRLTCHFLQGHDFIEGIRAVLIDKDQKPRWQPSQLSEVTETDVAHYFSPYTEELA